MVVIKGLAIIAGSSLMPLAAIGSKQPITLAKITVKKEQDILQKLLMDLPFQRVTI